MKVRAMAFGGKVRLFWTTAEPGAVAHAAIVIEAEVAAELARDLADAAMKAVDRPRRRLVGVSSQPDGTTIRTYAEDL